VAIVKQQETNDCHVPLLANLCNVSYDKAASALNHINLPGMLESPIFSNPWNVYRGLARLGFWKRNLTWEQLTDGTATPDKVGVLVKKSLLVQHWVVWSGIQILADSEPFHRVYWLDSDEPIYIPNSEFKLMFERKLIGKKKLWVCAFEVYKAKWYKVLWYRLLSWFKSD
jgi:hypothetical protein